MTYFDEYEVNFEEVEPTMDDLKNTEEVNIDDWDNIDDIPVEWLS